MDPAWLAGLAAEFGGSRDLRTTESPSGALITYAGTVVIKVHHPRTDPRWLAARLRTAADTRLHNVLVAPVSTIVYQTPDGRSATVWPRLEVLGPVADELPWAAAGSLLATLHAVDHELMMGLPSLRPTDRLERALGQVPASATVAPLLVRTGSAVIAEAATVSAVRRLVHGDWHLGQLGRHAGGAWQLLDIDDIGVGDPVWDLARPAGFWAAGLIPDADWDAFLAAYRAADGPALPHDGDPWSRLEVPARAAVVAAACRAVIRPQIAEPDIADALFEACRRM